jgi:hypothetical protein
MLFLVLGYGTLLLLGPVAATVLTFRTRGAAPLSPAAITALAGAQLVLGLADIGVGWQMRGVLDMPGAGEGGLLTLFIFLAGWAVCALGATVGLAGALQLARSPWARPLQGMLTALLAGAGLLLALAILGWVQQALFGD